AYEKKLNADSARLFAQALEADPTLVGDRQAQHRYNAACAAALAAAGSAPRDGQATSGQSKEPRNDVDCARLRNQARGWLDAELKSWSQILESAKGEQRKAISDTLKHWQQDTDLVGVRDKEALASLPERERAGWQSLWADVDRLLKEALAP